MRRTPLHPDKFDRLKYTFDDVSSEDPACEAKNEAQSPRLDYHPVEPLHVKEGRLPGSRAVRLDRGYYSMPAPKVDPEEGFGFAVWVRLLGHGSEDGNGRPNGMLLAAGDGYWSGFRAYVDADRRTPRFQIGRPKPRSAVSATGEPVLQRGVWTHVVGSWDGHMMRLYVNGMLVAENAYDGPYTPPSSGTLRVGFAGAGVGSNLMDIDQFDFHGRPIAAEEAIALALAPEAVDRDAAKRIAAANQALRDGEPKEARDRLRAVVSDETLDPGARTLARILLGDVLSHLQRNAEAVDVYVNVYRTAAAPRWKKTAAARLLPKATDPSQIGGAVPVRAPVEVYRELYESTDGEMHTVVGLALAEALVRAGRTDAAVKVYDELLAQDGLASRTRVDIVSQKAEAKMQQAAGSSNKRGTTISQLAETLKGQPEISEWLALVREGYEASVPLDEVLKRWRPFSSVQSDPSTEHCEYFVAPDGDDANPGTRDAPFATLEAARDALRKRRDREGRGTKPAVIFVRGGRYPVRSTLELAKQDSGRRSPFAPTIIRAYKNEKPVFDGGCQLRNFRPVKDQDMLARLPAKARDHVMVSDPRAAGVEDFGEMVCRGMGRSSYPVPPWVDLFAGDRAMTLARWPNADQPELLTGEVHRGGRDTPEAGKAGEFSFRHERLAQWESPQDPWMEGKWGRLWASRLVPVEQLDLEAGRIHAGPGSGYGFRQGMPFHFVNVFEEIDTPGEWFLDRERGLLYFWPPDDLPRDDQGNVTAQFPILETPFIRIQNAECMLIQGLTFENARADGIALDGCVDCLLAGCTVKHVGGNALVIAGGSGCGAAGCDLYSLGAGGVRMRGGDRTELVPGRHFVTNCMIADFARVDRSYAPALHIDDVGHCALHNLIFDSPHHALRIEGDLHTVALNRVCNVVHEFDDQGGIDVWGDPTYRGNRFFWNHWRDISSSHDVAGQCGIRLDDMISATFVFGNVFERAAGGRFGAVQIHGGKDNMVHNNLFVDCQASWSFSPWSEARYVQTLARPDIQAKIEQGVNRRRLERFPSLTRLKENPNRNFLSANILVNCPRAAMRENGQNVYMANNMFQGSLESLGFRSATDFTLRPDARILELTLFEPIPFDRIGLYAGDFRESVETPRRPVHLAPTRSPASRRAE
ncbi:MAG: LamG-like jellyroll fold domain-containing protein [Pirellulaceae bacterium]